MLVLLLLWLARRMQLWLADGPLLQSRLDSGARQAMGTLVRYLVLLIGLLAIVQTACIDLTTFNVLAGAVIVPNSKFITENVVNWKYNDDTVRFRIPLGVAYGSDARQVERILLELAAADTDVLQDPPPVVRFVGFGDDGLLFELRAWSASLVDRKGRLISQLNFAIYDRFQREGIEFPFPQRDLHLKSGVLELRRAAPRAAD